MASHHHLGRGRISAALREAALDPAALRAQVARMIGEVGLTVVASHDARFPHGGLTAVWLLAESHLVLHVWAREGFATVDLHVCDYERPGAARAHDLARRLSTLCFRLEPAPTWRVVELDDP